MHMGRTVLGNAVRKLAFVSLGAATLTLIACGGGGGGGGIVPGPAPVSSAPPSGQTPPPTQAPGQTPPPTQAPGQTPPPTQAPGQTPPPTQAPGQTPPPTQAPGQTPPPTQAPGQTPPPTQAPCQTPPPTQAPGQTPPPTQAPPPPQTPPPPTPPPPTANVTAPPSVAFSATGAAFAQNVAVSEKGYTGVFSASLGSCNGIVSVSPAMSASLFTVTPQGAGTCSLMFSDAIGDMATTAVSVTTMAGPPSTGTIAVSPSSLEFTRPNQSITFTASEAGYSGMLTIATGTCNLVSVSPSMGSAQGVTFTVTSSSSAGSCMISVVDGAGGTASVSVAVTLTQGTIQ